MFTMSEDSKGRLSKYSSEKAIAEIREAFGFGNYAYVKIGPINELPEKYYSVSYFDFSLLAQKIDNSTDEDLFYGYYRKTPTSETKIGTEIIGLWLPFALAGLSIFWSVVSNSVFAFINNILAVITGYAFKYFFEITDRIGQSLYNRSVFWNSINPYMIISLLMLIFTIWFMVSRHDYKSNKRYAKRHMSNSDAIFHDNDEF